MTSDRHDQAQLTLGKQALAFLLAFVVLVARRPDAVLHPQFWAEDGRIFYADAYNFGGWSSFFHSYAGYLHAVPRFGAALALLVPLSLAPLVMNVIALAIQAIPVNLLLSFRSSAWGSLRFRAALAGMYLVLPNCWELSAIISNSQWVLALCAFLVLVARPTEMRVWRLLDVSILLFCGLSGPFCIVLLPVAVIIALKRKERARILYAGLLGACCLVQGWELMGTGISNRSHYILGASPALFVRILAGQVYLGALLGSNGLAAGQGLSIFLACVAVGGTALIALCFVVSGLEMRLFLFLAVVLLFVSLISPATWPPPGVTAWQQMSAGAGIRYWFFPNLAFAWSILSCDRSIKPALRVASFCLSVLMLGGILRDFQHVPFIDLNFRQYAQRFESSPIGTKVTIPLNPPSWEMDLVKHGHTPYPFTNVRR